MTYSNTTYEIVFEENHTFRKFSGVSLVSTESEPSLIDRLSDCGKQMKKELESIQ